jgi:hypothetical protein
MEIHHKYIVPSSPVTEERINNTHWNDRLKIEKEFNVKDYGALGNGIDNDKIPIYQAMIAAYEAGGGTIFFPEGIYYITGDLETNENGANALFPLPYRIRNNTTTQRVLRFKGEIPPAPDYTLLANGYGNNPPMGGTILYTDKVGSGAFPSMFDAGNSFSNIYTIFENLTFRQTLNPKLIALRLYGCTNAEIRHCNFDVNVNNPYGITSAPTDISGGPAVCMPANENSGFCLIENCFITGYYRGLDIFEHSTMNNIFMQSCDTAIGVNSMGHSAYANRLMLQWCKHYLTFLPYNGFNNAYFLCNILNIEGGHVSDGRWDQTVDHINDPNNHIKGAINLFHYSQDASIIKNGGTNLEILKTTQFPN